MNRINERKTCFEIIFTFSFDTNKSIDEIIEVYKETNELDELSDYVLNTVNGVFENLQVIDEKIKTSIKGRKFERLDNVCLTPHMAWAAYEARCRCLSETEKNIISFLSGGDRNRVDLK